MALIVLAGISCLLNGTVVIIYNLLASDWRWDEPGPIDFHNSYMYIVATMQKDVTGEVNLDLATRLAAKMGLDSP